MTTPVHRLLERVGNPLEWPDIDKALAAAPRVGILDDVRLNLTRGSAQPTSLDVYAKVVAIDGAGRVHLRFTSTPPEVLTYFEGLLGN